MRKIDLWFAVTVKEAGIFKDVHTLAKSQKHAESWGEQKYGKVFGVRKINRDELISEREKSHQMLIQHQQPLGLQITRKVYETDFDLTDMLFGERKKEVKEKKVEKKSKWDLIAENEQV